MDADKVAGTVQGITERNRSEAEVRFSERQLISYIEHAGDAIYVVAQDSGRIVYCNQQACRDLGYSRDELLQMSARDIETELKAEDIERVHRSLDENPKLQLEGVHRRKDGTTFPVEINLSRLDGAETPSLLSLVRDITERKQAEAAARDSEIRFTLMADAAPVLIWESGVDKLCNYFNKTWLDFTGRSLEREMGNGWADGVHPDDLARCLEIYVGSFDARREFEMEYRLRRHDGQYRWILDHGVPRFQSGGSFAGYIGSCIDITERIQQQQQLKGLLSQTEQDARTKTELLREVNHRVTNNLTSILGLFVREQKAVEPAAKPVVQPVLDRLTQRIRGLLTAHRLLSQSSWAPLRVDRLAEKIITAALSANPSTLPAQVQITPGPCEISPRQSSSLALVLNELTTNSIKHGRVKDRPLTISLEAGFADGFVTVCYRDNGPGFTAEVIAGTRDNVGQALICQLVTESLQGDLTLANEAGATVRIRIRPEEPHRT